MNVVEKRKKSLVVAVFILALLTAIPFTAFASSSNVSNVTVKVNGSEVFFPDEKPFIDQNNKTLVPVRFISEELGAEVKWCSTQRKVTITNSNKEIQLIIGQSQATVNGEVISFDTSAVIVGTRTMVPLRFISESLGVDVGWNSETRTVLITTGETKPLKEVISNPEALKNDYVQKVLFVENIDKYELSIYEGPSTKFIKARGLQLVAFIKDDKIIATSGGYIGEEGYEYFPIDHIDITEIDYIGTHLWRDDTLTLIANPFVER